MIAKADDLREYLNPTAYREMQHRGWSDEYTARWLNISIHTLKQFKRQHGLLKVYKKQHEIGVTELKITDLMLCVNSGVLQERLRQNQKWGLQRHSNGDWLMILTEEVGEVAEAMQKEKGWGKETDASNLYEELIHVAAVASAIAEQVLEGMRDDQEGGCTTCLPASDVAGR